MCLRKRRKRGRKGPRLLHYKACGMYCVWVKGQIWCLLACTAHGCQSVGGPPYVQVIVLPCLSNSWCLNLSEPLCKKVLQVVIFYGHCTVEQRSSLASAMLILFLFVYLFWGVENALSSRHLILLKKNMFTTPETSLPCLSSFV